MSAEVFGTTFQGGRAGTLEDEGKGGILLPDVTWRRHRPVSAPLTEGLLKELADGKKRIWVWVEVDYVDIFREPWHAEFRFWSGRERREHEIGDKEHGEYINLIADKDGTKATYANG